MALYPLGPSCGQCWKKLGPEGTHRCSWQRPQGIPRLCWRGSEQDPPGADATLPSANPFEMLPFNTAPSVKLTAVLVEGMMPIFRYKLKVPNAGPLSWGSFAHIGIIEIGIC